MGVSGSHLIDDSLGQSELTIKMASRSVQVFFAQVTAECPYTVQWAPISPQNFPFPWGSGPHLTHDFLGPFEPTTQWHLNWLSHFCRAHDPDQQTVHTSPSVTIGCIYIHSTAIRPNNNSSKLVLIIIISSFIMCIVLSKSQIGGMVSCQVNRGGLRLCYMYMLLCYTMVG